MAAEDKKNEHHGLPKPKGIPVVTKNIYTPAPQVARPQPILETPAETPQPPAEGFDLLTGENPNLKLQSGIPLDLFGDAAQEELPSGILNPAPIGGGEEQTIDQLLEFSGTHTHTYIYIYIYIYSTKCHYTSTN